MCRLTAYVGPPIAPAHLVTRPSRSIIRQSYAARERVTERGYLNGDGFGLGWYPLVPVLEDSPSTCAAELRPNQGPQDHRAQPEHSSCSTTTSPRESCENEDANDNQQQQEQQHHAPCSFSSTAEARHRASLEAHGPDIPPPNSESLAGTCFQRSEPCVFTGTGPAWNSTNLRQLSESITASIVFAHVRAATEGTDVTELSCHPFRFGRYMFMHNGNIGNFERVRRLVLPTLEGDAFDFAVARGSSDSALCFAMFLNRLPRDPSTPLTCEQIREHVVSVIKDLDTLADKHNLRQASMLNFVLTDGEHTVCTRYLRDPDSTQTGAATLYFSAGAGYECVHDSMGVYRMSHADRRHRVVIVASEPLTNTTSDWLPVPPGYTLTISREIDVLLSPIHGEQPSCHPSVTDCLTRSCVPKSAQAVANCDVSSMTAGHHDISHTANVLCFEIVGSLVFTGSNASTITVWDSETWRRLAQLEGHDDAVLSLTSTAHANARCHSSSDGDNGHDDGGGDGDDDDSSSSSNTSEGKAVSNKDKDHILFSASSDSTVRSWRANAPFSPLMTVSFLGMGDVTSLAILGRSLFAGFQDTKIRMLPVDVMLHPIERVHSQQRSGDVALDTLKQFALDDFNESPHATAALPTAPRRPDDSPGFLVRTASGKLRLAGAPPSPQPHAREQTHTREQTQTQTKDASSTTRANGSGGSTATRALAGAGSSRTSVATMASAVSDSAHDDGMWTPKECQVEPIRVVGVHASVMPGLRELGEQDNQHTSHFSIVHSVVVCGATLISGAGDGLLKMWDADTLACKATVKAHFSSVQVLAAWQQRAIVFSGSRDCTVRSWDIDNACSTGMCTHFPSEVLSLALVDPFLFCGLDDGSIHLISPSTLSPRFILGHGSPGPVQCMMIDVASHRLFSAVDHNMRIWSLPRDLTGAADTPKADQQQLNVRGAHQKRLSYSESHLHEMLEEFVSLKSVSSDQSLKGECFDAARYLQQVLKDHGCSTTQVLDTVPGKSPLVLGRLWIGNDRPTMFIYGHYDVMPASNAKWSSDPFTLTARNGYWYGRGATDDKGPILATILAASELLSEGKLGVNVIFMYEGEAENHSGGFQEALDRIATTPSLADVWHPRIDYIFISNNYWIDDERPCLTYAMRGHIRMVVSVQGPKQNVHAGVDGGAVVEPTIDLCYILGTLVDGAGRVCVPGFYEDVRASSEDDDAAFDRIAFDTTQYRHELGVQRLAQAAERNALRARWAEPTLSITNVQTSNGDQAFSVIPHKATAQVSIRFVPDQKADEIVTVVRHHLEHEFNKRNSGNQLSVEVVQVSQWWRSETSSPYFGAARAATKEVWGCEPLLVCEGGTMHTTCMLVDHFEAPALHLPMGQSSDGAHLPNERIRIQNLVNGQAVVYSFLEHLSKEGTTEEGDEGDRDELVA